jgi:exopolysaccharide production protein ExoQ
MPVWRASLSHDVFAATDQRAILFGEAMTERGPGLLRGRMAFWVSTASLATLLMTVRLGSIAPAGFIGIWCLFFLAWPRFSAGSLSRTLLLWIFPLFALTSVSWSLAPDVTARNAVEWVITAGIGVLMASALPTERLLASWMLALLPIVVVSGVVGGSQFTETGDVAAIGIFGSKNNFALHISETFLLCVAVLASAKQPRLPRVIALFGCAATPLLLWRAKSVGALAVFLPSLLMLCAVIGLGRMRRLREVAVVAAVVVTVVAAGAVVPIAVAAKGDMLNSVGKSEDLTGRGLLWQRAAVLIQQRPGFGVGYSAFWRQGNPEAEALWRAEHIASRGGFHFHSFYYETLVELGETGMAVGITVLGLTGAAVLAWGLRMPGPESGFFCAIVLFLLLRSFVELDLLGGFGLNTLLLAAAWVSARSRGGVGEAAVRRRMPAYGTARPRPV